MKFSVNTKNAAKWHNSVWDFFYEAPRTDEEIKAHAAKLIERTNK